MGHNSTHLVRMVKLDGTDFIIIAPMSHWWFERVNLRQKARGRVVEETAYDGGAFDEPVVFVVSV